MYLISWNCLELAPEHKMYQKALRIEQTLAHGTTKLEFQEIVKNSSHSKNGVHMESTSTYGACIETYHASPSRIRSRPSTTGKLVVWVGGLDFWDPLMKGIVTYGYTETYPNQQFTIKAKDHPNNIQEYFKKTLKNKAFKFQNLSSPSFSPANPPPPNAWDAPCAAAAAPPVAALPEAPRAAAAAAPAVGSALRRGDGPARVRWPLRRYERLLELEATSGPGFRKFHGLLVERCIYRFLVSFFGESYFFGDYIIA